MHVTTGDLQFCRLPDRQQSVCRRTMKSRPALDPTGPWPTMVCPHRPSGRGRQFGTLGHIDPNQESRGSGPGRGRSTTTPIDKEDVSKPAALGVDPWGENERSRTKICEGCSKFKTCIPKTPQERLQEAGQLFVKVYEPEEDVW